MRVVSLLAIGAAVLVALAHAGTLGSVTCPTSNKNNTGCYCTFGCSINGDTVFPWNDAHFPPDRYDANTMGNDTICAKITIPALTSDAARNLSAYLGVTGNINSLTNYNGVANNTEVTLWTAFTQDECTKFAARVNNLVNGATDARGLNVELCTSESCNVVNLPAAPAATTVATNAATRLPGTCPIANSQNTSCYCTNGCSVDGDMLVFPWKAASWPPLKLAANTLGNDTICARITVPVLSTIAGSNLAAYLGITGNVFGNGTTYFGADEGQTVTVYTAFTAAECASFVTQASNLLNVNTTVLLCNTSDCNGLPTSAGNPPGSPPVDSSASMFYVTATIALAALFAFLH